jgi:3-oxoacyl-[acyl-carrier-protein] synthase-3
MNTYIKALAYYLPDKVLTNKQLVEEFPEWTVEKVAEKVGISTRHISADNETAGDMAEQAALKLFQEWNITPDQIDFILLCTQSPDYFFPTTACILQNRLQIPTNAGALDFNLGCSGYVYGLALAKGLAVAGIAKNILLITSETYSKHIHPMDKSNRTIFGDAATATLISDTGFAEIGEFALGTDGAGADNLKVKTGGMRYRQPILDVKIDEDGVLKSSDHLYMNGSEIFSFTQEMVAVNVSETLVKNVSKMEDMDLYIFHQANKYMLNFLRKKIKIPTEKFYIYMDSVGNTVSSTIPIALKEAISEKRIKRGDKVLIVGFGVGYSWGGSVLFFN